MDCEQSLKRPFLHLFGERFLEFGSVTRRARENLHRYVRTYLLGTFIVYECEPSRRHHPEEEESGIGI